MKKNIILPIICLISTTLSATALMQPSEEDLQVYSAAARLVVDRLPKTHLQRPSVDAEAAREAIEIFMDSLDFDRTIFLQSDQERFVGQGDHLVELIKDGDLEFAFEIYDLFIDRLKNRLEFVENILEDGFDLSEEEEYGWKRREMPRPADESAWDEVWRRKIKNAYLGYVIADKLNDEEAKQQDDNQEPSEQESDEISEDAPPALEIAETPEERILQQYRQLLRVMEDNDADWLLSLYITSYTKAIDPHSDYMSQRDIENFNITMSKSLEGIGAILNSEDGAAKIVRLVPGGPADLDGRLQPNDRIIAVGEGEDEPVDIRHWPLSRAVQLIRGEKGSRVVLSVIPASDLSGTTVKQIDIMRDEVQLEDQVAKGDVREVESPDGTTRKIGVITIPDFYADMAGMRDGREDARSVTQDVKKILSEFNDMGDIDGVIVDLRNNGGGALNEAIDLTGLFIKSGPVVQVKTQGRTPRKLYDGDPRQYWEGPLMVMVNRLSASASEIFAAALQDYGRAVIVGDSKTHGKGTVQALLPLSRSNDLLGSLKVTTAGFYRVAGESTQIQGVIPDIHLPSIFDSLEIGEDHNRNAIELEPVRPAFFIRDRQLDTILPKLQIAAEELLESNQQYQDYLALLGRIGARRQSETISLRLEDRLEQARVERKMQELVRSSELLDGDQDEDEDDDQPDIVLDKTLRVMSEFINLKSSEIVAEKS